MFLQFNITQIYKKIFIINYILNKIFEITILFYIFVAFNLDKNYYY